MLSRTQFSRKKTKTNKRSPFFSLPHRISEGNPTVWKSWSQSVPLKNQHRHWQSVWQRVEKWDCGRGAISHPEKNMHSCPHKCPILHYNYFSRLEHSYWNMDPATCYIGHWSHSYTYRLRTNSSWERFPESHVKYLGSHVPKAESTLNFWKKLIINSRILMQIISNAMQKKNKKTWTFSFYCIGLYLHNQLSREN